MATGQKVALIRPRLISGISLACTSFLRQLKAATTCAYMAADACTFQRQRMGFEDERGPSHRHKLCYSADVVDEECRRESLKAFERRNI